MSVLPEPLARAEVPDADAALAACVTSGTVLAAGLATSEPSVLYARLWDHVRAHDLTDVEVRQGLFMAPHPLLVGDELARAHAAGQPPDDGSAAGRALAGLQRVAAALPRVGEELGERVGAAGDRLAQLRLLTEHLDELVERRVQVTSAFLSPADNTVVPDTAAVRALAPRWAGRNRARSEVARWQPVHFPDGAWALSHDVTSAGARVDLDVYALVVTEPDAEGRLSLGMSNGVDGDVLPMVLRSEDTTLLLVVSSTQPWIDGLPHAPNHLHVDDLRDKAAAGRLVVLRDDTPVPALPPGAFEATDVEKEIGAHVAEHVLTHLDRTAGRALQVGIGGTGVQAVKRLDDGDWTGTLYTEMLDPVSWSLVASGTVTGAHDLRADGTRDDLDAVVCTFALGEEGDGFPGALDHEDGVRMARAGHVLRPAAFHGGLGINNVLGIDFNGHVNATGRGIDPWSGIGGAATIMRGLAVGGIAYLCLKSTYTDGDGEQRSTIVPHLAPGTPVALTGPDLFGTRDDALVVLATEQGTAVVNARDQAAFVRALLTVAHPDHHDELARAAWELYRVRP